MRGYAFNCGGFAMLRQYTAPYSLKRGDALDELYKYCVFAVCAHADVYKCLV